MEEDKTGKTRQFLGKSRRKLWIAVCDRVGHMLDFDCPRCSQPASQEFYGPCDNCIASLRAAHAGIARDVAAPEYEPKMNVTPNAVALKD